MARCEDVGAPGDDCHAACDDSGACGAELMEGCCEWACQGAMRALGLGGVDDAHCVVDRLGAYCELRPAGGCRR